MTSNHSWSQIVHSLTFRIDVNKSKFRRHAETIISKPKQLSEWREEAQLNNLNEDIFEYIIDIGVTAFEQNIMSMMYTN